MRLIIIQSQAMEFPTILHAQALYSSFQPTPRIFYSFPSQIPLISYGCFPSVLNHNFYQSDDTQEAQRPNITAPITPPQESSSSDLNRLDFSHTIKKNLKSQEHPYSTSKYAKKNAQSNMINQIFSYMSIRAKSHTILAGLLNNSPLLLNIYYETLKQLKKRNKKYLNRCYLKSLILMEKDNPIHSILRKADPEGHLKVEDLRKALRVLIIHYLRNVCTSSILTSAKLDPQTKNQHLTRRRDIEKYLIYHIQNSPTA